MSFWRDLIYFFSFQDANIKYVVLGTIILGFTCGIVGVIVVLSKKALIVDAISHAVLPGICIGFMFSGVKNPIYLSIGGMIAGAAAVYLVDWMSRISRIKKDASIAISLSIFFSFGVILLNIIQHSENSNQSGLTDFLFGKAATIIKSDLYIFSIIFGIVILTLTVFYQHFKILLFDKLFATTIGLSEKFVQGLISGLIIISTSIGIQTVGIVLMSALLITPASSALFWTNSFKKAILLSGLFATFSSVIGVFISFLSTDMPTGPWIIVVLSLFSLFSAFFSKKGLVAKKIKLLKNKKKLLSDNIIKIIYEAEKSNNQFKKQRTFREIKNIYSTSSSELNSGIKILKKHNYLKHSQGLYSITDKGIIKAKKIILLNVLWEFYMDKILDVNPYHLPNGSETINQIITPSIEAELIKRNIEFKIITKNKN
ncbi:MAG: zinc ABC transporter permease [Crocinitomicaceae bacterium]|nr:zinc ABC transporter permease [Crocinitomicaceae bacterium]|tara:strand:- start:50349 stop:51632 length:1284 start_codon:yes stop_codon:yes gene_type:complete